MRESLIHPFVMNDICLLPPEGTVQDAGVIGEEKLNSGTLLFRVCYIHIAKASNVIFIYRRLNTYKYVIGHAHIFLS